MMDPSLPFTAPTLLAPMEGITEPSFRGLVLACNEPAVLGGAFTEFVRVNREALPHRTLARHLGARPTDAANAPVGLQLMGSNREAVAESARRAEEVGAPLIDLNFGCPAPGALRGCAGSFLLDEPRELERLIAACVAAVERVPVTAKIRAGGEDDSQLEDIARAVEAGGARMLTVHCRTRREAYRDTADWRRLERAVGATSLPVCGNGGIDRHADIGRLLRETGCTFAMIGRAALGDPWIFSGRIVRRERAARFLLDYAERLRERTGAHPTKVAGRLKQLIRHWEAGGLFEHSRSRFLRERDPERLLELLRRLAVVAE